MAADAISKMPSTRRELTRAEEKLLVGREEAALMLSISKRSLDYLIASGDIAVRRIGTRVLIQAQELERFARGNHPGRLAG